MEKSGKPPISSHDSGSLLLTDEAERPPPDFSASVRPASRNRMKAEIEEPVTLLPGGLEAMERLHAVSMRLIRQEDESSLLEDILEAAIDIAKADFCTIHMLDPSTKKYKMSAHRGFQRPFLEFFETLHRGEAACGQAMDQGKRVIVEDVTQSPLFQGTEGLSVLLAAGVRSIASMPLTSRDARLVGVLSIQWRLPHRPDEYVLRLMDLLAAQAANAIERVRAEGALRESEKRFRTSVETMLHGFAILSAIRDKAGRVLDFRCEYINESGSNMIGRDRRELVGQDFIKTFPVVKESEVLEGILRTVETGEPLVKEAFVNKGSFSGREALTGVFDMRAAKMGDGVAISWTDVTERSRMEEALKESESRFRTSIEILPEGFILISAVRDGAGRIVDFRCEFINEAACRMAGCRPEDRLKRCWLEVRPEITESELFRDFVRAVETGEQLVRNEVGFPGFKDGEYFPDRAYNIRAAKLGDGLVVSWIDVTDRRESAVAMARRAEELRESEKRFHGLFDQSPLGAVTVSPDFRFLEINTVFADIVGYSREELASLTFPDFTHPDDLEAELALSRRLLKGEIEQFEMEKRYIHKNGGIVWVRVHVGGIRDEKGRLLYFLRMVEDITEKKRTEKEKENLWRELSHRTKNNMQVIVGLLGLQAAQSKDTLLTVALAEAQNRIRAMALVHEKLYKSGSVSSLNMKEYIEDLLTVLLEAHQGAKGRIRPFLDLEAVILSLDAAVPCGLIINELVSNSLKHAFGEEKVGNLFLSLRRSGENVEMRYKDDGPGLPIDLKLFQAESLGLKLVHNLAVFQLRGKIELVPDSRSEYVFRFQDLDIMKRI